MRLKSIYIFCWKVKGGVILAISDTKCRNITDFPSKTCIFENFVVTLQRFWIIMPSKTANMTEIV